MRNPRAPRRRAPFAGLAAALGVATLPGLMAARADAQDYDFRPRVQWEARADGLVASTAAAHVGAGANVPAGYYLRFGLTAAAGPTWQRDRIAASARLDLAARYLLDPFREIRWGVYGGAGLTARWDDASRWRGYLLLVAGVEGPEHGGWRTAIEAGLGGGGRLGVVLRRARRNGR